MARVNDEVQRRSTGTDRAAGRRAVRGHPGKHSRWHVGRRATGRGIVVATAVAVLLAGLVGVRVPPARAAEPAAQWTWPLDGSPPVARDYDPPAERYGTGHRGVDLGAAPGAPVLAAGEGRVSYAGLLAGRGVVVVVHGDLRTTYEPVTAAVSVGQQVAAGQPLGTLAAGHAGCPLPACLHWGLRRGEDYLDPLSLVDPGPPRLLPLLEPPGAASLPVPLAPAPAPAEPLQARDVALPPTAPVPAAESPAPDVDQGWALRSAQTPAGAASLFALLTGLALLAGRRAPARPRHDADGAASTAGDPERDGSGGWPADSARLVDLGVERSRRRPVA